MPKSPTPPALAKSLSKLSSASSPNAVLSAMPTPGGQNKTGSNSVSFGAKGMTIKSGKDTLDLSAGKLSIKSGNTSFDLQSLADGIKIQASDSASKKSSLFEMTSKGTTQIHKGPKSYSKVETRTDAFKDRAQDVSDNLWNAGTQASKAGRHANTMGRFDDSIFESSSRSSKGSAGPRRRRNSV